MATPARYVNLTPRQDERLRELEAGPGINAKVRLRASIVRLNGAGWTAPKLARHFGRSLQAVLGHAQLLGNLSHADIGLFAQLDRFALEFRGVDPAFFHHASHCASEA